jgi:hypothetical protein
MKPTYEIDYAIKRLQDAIDLAEMEGDFVSLRLALKDLKESIEIDQIADAKLGIKSGSPL